MQKILRYIDNHKNNDLLSYQNIIIDDTPYSIVETLLKFEKI